MGGLKASISSYAGVIQAAFHGFDTARFLQNTSAGFLFGNENVDIDTGIRSDNSIVVEHSHTINSATKGRRLKGLLGSNRAELEISPWLALSHIMHPPPTLEISDGAPNSTRQKKLILSLARHIPIR